MRTITYEGIDIELCDSCGGEWLDDDELQKIVFLREVRFNEEERRAIAQSSSIRGVSLADADRRIICPKCGNATEPIHYGCDTGIIIDRCTPCGGFWLDAGELEKVQMVAEGWQDALPDDLAQYGSVLRNVSAGLVAEDNVRVSRLPLAGRFINACVNGILDVAR
jgi:uncharacterized protein